VAAIAQARPRSGRGLGEAHSRVLVVLLVALAALAWALLWWWSASPFGRYVAHGGWTDLPGIAALCRAVPQGSIVVPAMLHALAWVLMIAAMMLPTTYPLLALFRRIAAGRTDAGTLVALVVAGFFVPWLAFGLAAHAVDALLVAAAARLPAMAAYGWAFGALVLAGAGAFQWSALKYRCLEECHSPFSFIGARWHGRFPRREAWRLGLDHGLFCVGCCWALMATAFAVGVMNAWWMAALGVVALVEQIAPNGHMLRRGLGGVLLGAGIFGPGFW